MSGTLIVMTWHNQRPIHHHLRAPQTSVLPDDAHLAGSSWASPLNTVPAECVGVAYLPLLADLQFAAETVRAQVASILSPT
jgi:hypothetical protein